MVKHTVKGSDDMVHHSHSDCRLALYALALAVGCTSGMLHAEPPRGLTLEKAGDAILLRTPRIAFQLAPEGAGMGVLGITGGVDGTAFVKRAASATQARMWRIVLADDRGKPETFITVDNRTACLQQTATLSDGMAMLTWRGVDVGEAKSTLDVSVRVALWHNTEMTDWRLRVTNRSARYGIWHIYCPDIELGVIGESGADDFLIMPPAEGRSVRDPIHWDLNQKNERTMHDVTTDLVPVKIDNDQPATGFGFGAQEPYGTPYATARGQFQLCGYYQKKGHFYYPSADPGPGLYLAAHDSSAYPKVFYATSRPKEGLLRFAVGAFPDDSARPGLDYEQTWPFVIGSFTGDWFDAAMIYREWALRQRWMFKGPLHRRGDVPPWAKRITAWVRLDSGKKRGISRMLTFANAYRARLEGTLAVQWYGWDVAAGATKRSMCCKFPPVPFAQDGFAEAVRDLQSRDMVVYPYVNTRLWATGFADEEDFADFEAARPYVEHRADGIIHEWNPGKQKGRFAKMCVQTDFWREYQTDVCRQIVADFGVKGLYLDQAAELSYGGGAYEQQGCHNASHGHPLGITRALFLAEYGRWREVLHTCRALQPELCICGEGNAEPFNDLFTNKLIHYEIWPGHVPLWAAVYHDYVTAFGRTASLKGRNKDDPIPQMQIGWQLVLGTQIGRLWPANFADPTVQRNLAYLMKACALRDRYHRYLTLGSMLRPPCMSSVPDVTTAEFRRINNLCTLPAIVAATWRAPDGSVAIVLSNISREAVDFTFSFEPEAYAVSPDVEIVQTFPITRKLARREDGQGRIACSMTMDGLDAVVLELLP